MLFIELVVAFCSSKCCAFTYLKLLHRSVINYSKQARLAASHDTFRPVGVVGVVDWINISSAKTAQL